MTNSRHSTSRRSFVLTVDTDVFEPELDEACAATGRRASSFTISRPVSRYYKTLRGETGYRSRITFRRSKTGICS